MAFLPSQDRAEWEASYVGEFPNAARHAEFFITQAGPPVIEL